MAESHTETSVDRYVTVREWNETAIAIDSENGNGFIRSDTYVDPEEKV